MNNQKFIVTKDKATAEFLLLLGLGLCLKLGILIHF